MFRFLYFSGLVRRNSFVNVVFAVGECGELGVRNGGVQVGNGGCCVVNLGVA